MVKLPQRLSTLKEWLRHPFLSLAFFLYGIFCVLFWAPFKGQELQYVKGGELVLLALASFLLHRHYRFFFNSILITAVSLPIASGFSAAIYYPNGKGILGIQAAHFLELFALALLPSLLLLFVFLWGRRWLQKQTSTFIENPPWLQHMEWFFEIMMGLVALTLEGGEWSQYAVFIVATASLLFLFGVLAIAVVRLRIKVAAIGFFMSIVGFAVVLLCLILVLTQNGRVSMGEATTGIIPGVILIVVGLLVGTKKGNQKSQSVPETSTQTEEKNGKK